jgi:hypothetical protein
MFSLLEPFDRHSLRPIRGELSQHGPYRISQILAQICPRRLALQSLSQNAQNSLATRALNWQIQQRTRVRLAETLVLTGLLLFAQGRPPSALQRNRPVSGVLRTAQRGLTPPRLTHLAR